MANGVAGAIFVTGGAGFLARALYARAEREDWPAYFTCFSRDDAKHAPLMRRFPKVKCIRGDVAGDREYLQAAMRAHRFVIHAAAVKYVDLAETNVFDTVRVNVHGSENVAWAAIGAGIEQVVGISTDKAALPANIYGMTKAVMERLFIEADLRAHSTRFALCRYGNVVGSTGSVIPLFKAQLAQTGRLRLTNPDMTRFWMSVDEAIDCILVALYNPHERGRTYIPQPRAMRMLDVAHTVALDMKLVDVVGLRPGEKLDELLLHSQESMRAVPIKRAMDRGFSSTDFWRGWSLRPPGEVNSHVEAPFEVSSANPPGGWMQTDELEQLIAEAAAI